MTENSNRRTAAACMVSPRGEGRPRGDGARPSRTRYSPRRRPPHTSPPPRSRLRPRGGLHLLQPRERPVDASMAGCDTSVELSRSAGAVHAHVQQVVPEDRGRLLEQLRRRGRRAHSSLAMPTDCAPSPGKKNAFFAGPRPGRRLGGRRARARWTSCSSRRDGRVDGDAMRRSDARSRVRGRRGEGGRSWPFGARRAREDGSRTRVNHRRDIAGDAALPIANARGTNAHLEVVVLWTTGASAADVMEAMMQRRRSTRRLRVRRCRRGGTRWLFFRYPQAGLFGGPESTAFGSTANRFHRRWASRDNRPSFRV